MFHPVYRDNYEPDISISIRKWKRLIFLMLILICLSLPVYIAYAMLMFTLMSQSKPPLLVLLFFAVLIKFLNFAKLSEFASICAKYLQPI